MTEPKHKIKLVPNEGVNWPQEMINALEAVVAQRIEEQGTWGDYESGDTAIKALLLWNTPEGWGFWQQMHDYFTIARYDPAR